MRIPRSLIQENLNTSKVPAPLYTETGAQYKGNIFQLVTGEYFTGNTYTPTSQQLFFKEGEVLYKTFKQTGFNFNRRKTNYFLNTINNQEYQFSKKKQNKRAGNIYIDNKILLPEESVKKPNTFDYLTGSMLRFIAKSKYNNSYFFTTLNSYKEYQKNINSNNGKYLSMFAMTAIPWYVRANSREDVIKINQFYVNKIKERTVFNDIERFIKEYDQYYRNENEQLYTGGRELVNSNGDNYSGLFHLHPEKGPMEGPVHTSKPHQQLFLKNTTISLEEGINNLSYVKTLKLVLKSLTINNIRDGRIISSSAVKNMYKREKQTQQELLKSNMSNQNSYTSGGSYNSGGGY